MRKNSKQWSTWTGVMIALVMFGSFAYAENGRVPTARPESVGMSSDRLERVSSTMQGYIDRNELAGTIVLIARKGKVVHFEAQGDRYSEEDLPMETDTIFRIASMTKPITSAALMMLWEEGHFILDDPISKWLPEFENPVVAVKAPGDERIAIPYKTVPANGPITVRHVLTHTAGLANTYRGYTRSAYQALNANGRPETVAGSMEQLATLPLNFQPGEAWEYGPGTSLCGVLVEKMSGMTLDEFFSERIFKPLGMHDTHFNLPHSKTARAAARYSPGTDGGLELVASPENQTPSKYFSGGGGLWSTAPDYWRFQQMILNGGELDGVRLLGRKTIETMTTNHTGDLKVWLRGPGYGFGLGYSILTDTGRSSEPLSEGSFGWGGAYNTYFWVDPQEDMIAIFMSQLRPYTHLNVRTQLSVVVGQALID